MKAVGRDKTGYKVIVEKKGSSKKIEFGLISRLEAHGVPRNRMNITKR